MTKERFYYATGGILLAASLAVRLAAYNIVTSDYTYFVAKWFDELKNHPGLSAFQTPFADYAPLYIYLIKILTYFPVSSLYSEKTLSFVFDILIAIGGYMLLKYTAQKQYTPAQLFFAFAVILSIPTMVVNTSLWGQSDSVYAAGIVFALYFILRDKPLPAVLAFALALSIKQQAIFFFPILLGFYLRKDYRLWSQLLLIPAVFVLTIIPAWLGGGSFMSLLLTYAHQAQEYTDLSVSAQSIFAYVTYLPIPDGMRSLLFGAGLLLTAAVGLGISVIIARLPSEKYTPTTIVFLSTLSVLLIPYLLPRMHERYFYLADILATMYAFYNPRRWFLPVIIIFASFISYMPFLSGQVSWFSALHIDLRVGATILLGVIVFMLYDYFISERATLT
jgi:Gpi18-like mannosyltransferase